MVVTIKKILCRVGIHRWVDTHQGPWDGWSQHVTRKCVCCGKRESLVIINPLSGPRV